MTNKQNSPFFQEVGHEWKDWMESVTFEFIVNNLKNGETFKRIEERIKGNSYRISGSYIAITIIYRLLKISVPKNIDMQKVTITVANKLYNPNLPDAIRAKEDAGLALCESIYKLEALISKACAINIIEPQLPSKEPLLEGINDLYEKLQYTNGRFEEMYQQATINAVIGCILIDEVDKGLQFLTFWKNYGKYRKHAQALKNICKELIKTEKMSIGQMPIKIEEKFFEIYNAYRHPIYKQCYQALNVAPPLEIVLLNYLLTWLYLKVFKGQNQTTWDEMRTLMLS